MTPKELIIPKITPLIIKEAKTIGKNKWLNTSKSGQVDRIK